MGFSQRGREGSPEACPAEEEERASAAGATFGGPLRWVEGEEEERGVQISHQAPVSP